MEIPSLIAAEDQVLAVNEALEKFAALELRKADATWATNRSRPPSTAYRFQKAFRRNKLVFTAATAVAAAWGW
jgi:hypothetical protein